MLTTGPEVGLRGVPEPEAEMVGIDEGTDGGTGGETDGETAVLLDCCLNPLVHCVDDRR